MKITFNAPVVLGFAAISLCVLLVSNLTEGMLIQGLFMTYHSSLQDPLTYVRLFTHVLGHADWEHYIGNMAYILLLGPMLEEKYGSKRLLQVIAITAVITGLIHYVFFPYAALCGASGVVFAFILLSSFTGMHEGEIPLTFLLVSVIFLGQQVHDAVMVQDDISNTAHILGGIIGSFVGFLSDGGRS